jgi:hypothetical protein
MGHLSEDLSMLRRRGHEGKHLSCFHCDRMVELHKNLNVLITSYETTV